MEGQAKSYQPSNYNNKNNNNYNTESFLSSRSLSLRVSFYIPISIHTRWWLKQRKEREYWSKKSSSSNSRKAIHTYAYTQRASDRARKRERKRLRQRWNGWQLWGTQPEYKIRRGVEGALFPCSSCINALSLPSVLLPFILIHTHINSLLASLSLSLSLFVVRPLYTSNPCNKQYEKHRQARGIYKILRDTDSLFVVSSVLFVVVVACRFWLCAAAAAAVAVAPC